MLSSELDFDLPLELIAQTPAEPRDSSRLLHFRRGLPVEAALTHRLISDLPEILQPGDLLVFNDTRVLRARLYGRKPTGGKVEALLLQEQGKNLWSALLKPSARLKAGQQILLNSSADGDESELTVPATLLSRESATWQLRFELPEGRDIRELLPQLGEVPVPPYIKTIPREEQYQTVFSKPEEFQSVNGAQPAPALDSAAAPTAGLHFSEELLAKLRARGIETAFLTLGVGMGTFQPVQTETLEEHVMHEEEFYLSETAARIINQQKRSGGRVIAVGTTTLRVLESVCNDEGTVTAGSGATSIFIRPGFRFRCVGALLTNFHLPCSTLLALVAAFMEKNPDKHPLNEHLKYSGQGEAALSGLAVIRYAYAQAIAQKYRFFSFGDAMFIE